MKMIQVSGVQFDAINDPVPGRDRDCSSPHRVANEGTEAPEVE